MTKTTETDDRDLTEFLETLPEKIPSVRLFYSLKQGRKVDIRLEVTGDSDDTPLMVELITQEGDLLTTPIPVNFPDLTASLTISETIKQGSYILRVTYHNCVLESTTFDVVDEESARQMEEFDRGLEVQDQVYQAIEESSYEQAFNLQKEVAEHFLNANNSELTASSWEDLADILSEKNELAFSVQASLYEKAQLAFYKQAQASQKEKAIASNNPATDDSPKSIVAIESSPSKGLTSHTR